MEKVEWPKRADGTNKTMGEMTSAERRAQIAASVQRIKTEFEQPAMRAAVSRYLNGDLDA